MDRSIITTMLPTLVAPHLPRNIQRFKYRIYDSQHQPSALGFYIDPQPFKGKIVAKTEAAIVVKIARTQFAVIDRTLVTDDPAEGSQVEVVPYARRRFDGERIDTPTERSIPAEDGTAVTYTTMVLGGEVTRLPIDPPKCPELATMIQQLEDLPAPDRYRRITHLLVDAGAKDIKCVDPQPQDVIRTPPAICFSVSTAKFSGQLILSFDRGRDVYVVELFRNEELIERVDEVHFDTLGHVLEHLIDDGAWQRIHIKVLEKSHA